MSADTPALTIARLGRLLESHATPELTLSQFRVLGLLSGGDERSTALASRLAVAKPTLTSLIDSLVERGFVAREAAAGDRRVVQLAITATGREALAAADRHLASVLDDVVQRCDDPAAVLDALDQIRRALDSRWKAVSAEPTTGAVR
jgi:DNA-binding MarR family transcriptional regulator